jgi:hypothetical protein
MLPVPVKPSMVSQSGPRLGYSGYTEPDGGPSSEVNLLIPDRAQKNLKSAFHDMPLLTTASQARQRSTGGDPSI